MEYSVSNILLCLGNLCIIMKINCYFPSTRRPPAPGMVRLLPAGYGHSRDPGLDLVQTPVSLQSCSEVTAGT